MQKFINDPQDFVVEMLDGIMLAHQDQLRRLGDVHSIVRAAAPVPGKVGIVTGGGSGHLPLFLGYVGEGLLDGVAVGDIFASPTPEQILEVTREVDSGAGVLYVIYRRVHRALEARGITIHRRWVGEFVTSLEMAGASLSIMALDDELVRLVDAPVHTPFFKQSGGEQS